ncbi:hypothetical protein ACYREY_09385 [Listeria welshimeri]
MTKIHSNDQIFHLAYKDGWVGLRGTKINIQGIDFSFCPLWYKNNFILKISEVDSGALLFEFTIPYVMSCVVTIREDLIEYYVTKIVPIIELLIKENGIEKIREETEKTKEYMTKRFGDMPDISDLEVAE